MPKETAPEDTRQVISEEEFFAVLNQVLASLEEQIKSLNIIPEQIQRDLDKGKRVVYYKDASGQIWFESTDKKIGFL